MDNDKKIPIDVILSGRSMEKVLEKYMSAFNEIKSISIQQGKILDDAVYDAITISAYRIYLLGVEDGMNAGGSK